MAKLPDDVRDAIDNIGSFKVLVTADKQKMLNAAPINSIMTVSDEILAFADVFMGKTKENLNSWRKVAICVTLPQTVQTMTANSWQVKGTFLGWQTSGEVYDMVAARIEGMGVPPSMLKGVGRIKVTEVYSLSPAVAGLKLA